MLRFNLMDHFVWEGVDVIKLFIKLFITNVTAHSPL